MTQNAQQDKPLVIAIDGPSGSGKSSTSRGVAERLGLAYLDTGAMYRAATWLVLERGVDPDDHDAVVELLSAHPVEVGTDPGDPRFQIGGQDVTSAIREPGISAQVSRIATNQRVRDLLIAAQRAIIASAAQGVVAEGRDITTVVAPDAHLRLLLVADPQARVARRQAELGKAVAADQVSDQVLRRDRDDSTVAQFTEAAPGVQVIDSTFMDLDQVITTICRLASTA